VTAKGVAIESHHCRWEVWMQTFSLPPEILSVSAGVCIGLLSTPVLPSAASAVRDITTYKCLPRVRLALFLPQAMVASASALPRISWQMPQSRLGLVGQCLSFGLGLGLEGLKRPHAHHCGHLWSIIHCCTGLVYFVYVCMYICVAVYMQKVIV